LNWLGRERCNASNITPFYLWIKQMADIYVSVRNQDGIAMSSINGEPLVVLITRDGLFQDQQSVAFRTAVAIFQELPAGRYTVIARHPNTMPTEARHDVELSEKTIFGIRFIYNELPRRKRTGYQNQKRASCSSLCNWR
jgi:hypothetical protein